MAIGSVERAFDILELLARGGPQRFTDIRGELDVPKGSLHNLLKALETRGYVYLDDRSGEYQLSAKVVELSGAYLSSLRLGDIIPPALGTAVEKSGETFQFALLDGTDVLYIYKEQPESTTFIVGTSPGKRLPAQFTALGKAILSSLDDEEVRGLFEGAAWKPLTQMSVSNVEELILQLHQVRDRGWAVDDEESSMGIMCIAVPVMTHDGEALGAISTSFIKRKHSWDKIPALAEIVQECAQTISSRLGHTPKTLNQYTSLKSPVVED
jgi:DNA-binding IclR family transcriptional regulator